MSHFEKRVQLNKIIESQLPEFLVADFPKAVEFFKQYYLSLEKQGGNVDLVDNLDRYIKVDNLVPETVVGETSVYSDFDSSATEIEINSVKSFPDEYGLLKINDEIITYTGITSTSSGRGKLTGCVRGFSGVTGYNVGITSFFTDTNRQNVVFSTSSADSHKANDKVTNLSVLFLQEFYKKLKRTFTPGLEDQKFVDDLDVGNFIKHARNFYQSKGIAESIRILFKVLYGEYAQVLDLETRLIKPSSADYIRREVLVVEAISGNPFALEGQTIFKSDDPTTNASVSDVEIFTRDNKTFYRVGLFVGYSERDLIEGLFGIPGRSKAIERVNSGSSVVTVDSTVGFGNTGTVVSIGPSGNNTFDYTSKSVTQFFGCTGITNTINTGDAIRADQTVYGYGNGDIEDRIDLRITGVLSNFTPLGDIALIEKDEEISVRNIGEIVENPITGDKTYKEVFSNSWIYNTASRYIIQSINGSTFKLKSKPDKSSLKVGDTFELLRGDFVLATITIGNVNQLTDEVDINNLPSDAWGVDANGTPLPPNPTTEYSIRRKLEKAKSNSVNIDLGNDIYSANVLNVYNDDQVAEGYVASHSLPSYPIESKIIESSIPDGSDNHLSGYDSVKKSFSTIKFASAVDFIDGDEIIYTADNPLSGLVSEQSYYVRIVTVNEIYLYASKSQIEGDQFVRFGSNQLGGVHRFTLIDQKDRLLGPKHILRKFELTQSGANTKDSKRESGSIGILIDGVEISSPESDDKVYYGPIKEFEILNSGKGYDVVNPPQIEIAAGFAGTAKVEPIITGSVKEVHVDPHNFDVSSVTSLTLTGGNGSGCFLEPIVGNRFREFTFDSRRLDLGGGVDINTETITFREDHFLKNGDPIIYNRNGNAAISIGQAFNPNQPATGVLGSGDTYYVGVANTNTIQLYKNAADAPSEDGSKAGINTIGLSTTTTASGIHKFRTLSQKVLRKIKVISPGSGYQHRKLRVKSSGISTVYDTISYDNHGFETGEIVNYSIEETTEGNLSIAGLSTSNQYSILKLDADKFRLINVGAAASLTSDLKRGKYVDISGIGSGYHVFQYPPIVVTENVSFGSTLSGSFTFTPIVTGEITGSYLYEGGVGYGSSIINLHKRPKITVKNGKNAQLNPIISNGRIIEVQVMGRGSEYFSMPEIRTIDANGGTGASFRPVIEDGEITKVIVTNSGLGYDPNTTILAVDPSGKGAIFSTRVRDLEVNNAERYGDITQQNSSTQIFSNVYQRGTKDGLSYSMYGYSQDLASNGFEDVTSGAHSPIIGWAYDGNPIYGPFGYIDPDDTQSTTTIIRPGYELDTSSVFDRPANKFPAGFFIEDYKYTNSGELDRHNGRFCKTPEFPNGTYAYFVGVQTSTSTNKLIPSYPYFVGNTYKNDFIEENKTLDHSFDFNSSTLVRNTFPHKVNDPGADYDFFNESYESFEQISVVRSVTQGDVEDIEVIEGGTGYRIGERLNFDETDNSGSGLKAEVSELIGKDINKIETELYRYENTTLVWNNENQVSAYNLNGFDLEDGDTVSVSGLSSSIINLAGSKTIGFGTETVSLASTAIAWNSVPGGVAQDIYVSSPPTVSIGGSMVISSAQGIETVKVLEKFNNGIIRVHRTADPGVAHTLGSKIHVLNDRIKLKTKTTSFESKRNVRRYFNAKDAVGIGLTTGSAVSKLQEIGRTSAGAGTTFMVNIPHRTIYIPNHPFKTGEKVTFSKTSTGGVNPLTVGLTAASSGLFFLPDSFTNTSDVYVINKGKNYIGLVTQIGLTTSTDGLYFHTDGSDNNEYLIETNYSNVTANVDRIVTTVSTGSSHGLKRGDTVRLSVVPNTVVGVGSTAPLTLKLNKETKQLVVNPVGFDSSQINIGSNTINIPNHGFETGDKLFYTSTDEIASGLTTGSYYAIKESSSIFRLAETYYESQPQTESSINLTGIGGSEHSIARINPKIDVDRNSSIKFLLGDESLQGYQLKIFREREFKTEFLSTIDNRDFNVIGIGSVGFGTASLTIDYSKNIPNKLFYALEKSGYISTADVDVVNHSEINYVDSAYNGSYSIFGISTTSFSYSPSVLPSVLSYQKSETSTLEYATKSSNAISGSIGKVKITSKGFNFNKLPKFIDVTTQTGRNANVVAVSTSIGRVKSIRMRDIGYDYPSDKTLRPEAFVSPIVTVDDLDTIDRFDILSGGSRYLNAPDIKLWNDTKKTVVDETSLIAETPNGAVSEITQLGPLLGLESEPHKVIFVNNSNGVGIVSIQAGHTGIATCTLKTPFLGYNSPQFNDGDEIFIEGIELAEGSTGDGWNSENYEYRFFKVKTYVNTNPAKLEFEIKDELGNYLSANPGIAKTYQSGYATIVNRANYPNVDVIQKRALFSTNEKLFVDSGTGFIDADVFVALVRDDYIKIRGRFDLRVGNKIKGQISGAVATVTKIDKNRSKFEISYSSKKDIGWRDDVGKISADHQRTPDNDYYQNLSYSVKSPITWDTFSNPVNSVVHPAGLKNFADVGITSETKGGVNLEGSTKSVVILDVVNEKRVDTINNFDNVTDYDSRGNQSKFLKLQNRKLTDYNECRTNRVLIHDDISTKFSSRGFKDGFVEIEEIDFADTHVRYTIQVVDPDTFESQITELIVQSTSLDSHTLEKHTSFTKEKLGDYSVTVDETGRKTLIFTPTDPFDRDHDIKVLKKTYQYSAIPFGETGIGTVTVGSLNIDGRFISGIASVSEETIMNFDGSSFNGAFANIEIVNRFTKDVEYIEAALDFDGTNTFISEYYFDDENQSYSGSQIGIVTASYNSGTGIVSFMARNEFTGKDDVLDIRANIVGFGTVGVGTYRFLVSGQPPESERSARLESMVASGSNPITVGSYNAGTVSSVNALVRVSAGSSTAIHQVAAMNNRQTTVTVPGPFAPINNTSGLGTFGSEISGSNFILKFYPDAGYTVDLSSYNEVFYTDSDFDNDPRHLNYGPAKQRVFLSAFDGLNGERANRTKFPITHEGISVYNKTFNPSDSATVDLTTGLFTIPNHFFNTGEELIYTPKSTFIGVGASAMGIGATMNVAGVVTDRMPTTVFPIVQTPDTFFLAAREDHVDNDVRISFTDVGEGNAHQLEMTKKLSKTVVALDGIVQQPVAFTPVRHTLLHNNGGITAGISTFNISGISSIQPRDLLKIDDEYMKVVEVGLSTNVGGQLLGPINGIINAGTGNTFPTVSVVRASVGSTAVAHSDGANVQIHRGAINIVGGNIHFIEAPKGNTRARRNESNLPYVKAEYSGRTFLRQDYSKNMVFDDISDSFTGIAKTYTATVGGFNTTGPGQNALGAFGNSAAGNGILFINGVFQTPSTLNNSGNNYDFETQAGITSVVFTGISSVDGSYIKSDFDINQNQLPRGGLIVSLGSTPGLGYAPLLGGRFKAELDADGSIVGVVGVNTYFRPVGIVTAEYTKTTGVLQVQTDLPHNMKTGELVKMVGLSFTCTPAYSGVTTTIFPDHNRPFEIERVLDANNLRVQVGTSTITHHYVGLGSIYQYRSLTIGSGYRSPVSIGVTDQAYEHKFVRAGIGSINSATNSSTHTALDAVFTSHTGLLRLNIPNHGLTTSDTIAIDTGSLTFTCSEDYHYTEQVYPRPTDPIAGIQTAILTATNDDIIVNVGPGGGAGKGATIEAIVGAGGTLALNVTAGGSGYINPEIIIPEPNYENIPVEGVSRLGIGATTEVGKNLLMNFTIGPNQRNVLGDRFYDAANLIDENKVLISEIAYGRMLAQFPSYTPPSGTTGRDCKDDIVDVLESTIYNLRFGGNDKTVDAANLYISGAHVAGEEAETIYAFGQAKELAVQAMRNEAMTIGGYSTLTQFFDLTVTSEIQSFTPTNATYTASNGNFVITLANHGFQIGDQVKLVVGSFEFTCSKDGNATVHSYPRATDPAANVFLTIDNVTTNTFRVNVGASPSGQQYTHTFVSAAPGAVQLKLTSTTSPAQCANVQSAIHTLVGIVTMAVDPNFGTTPTRTVAPGSLSGVETFEIARNGYAFQVGDVFRPVGMVTDRYLTAPIEEAQFEVVQTFNDFYSAWSFGEMNYLDSVSTFQDGSRVRFPLYYQGQLLSFEIDSTDPLAGAIDLDSVLLIFVNGVLQTPGYAYQFTGGTSFLFTEAPDVNDKVDIFFYVGQDNVDVTFVNVEETIKIGDEVQVNKHPLHPSTVSQQRKRTIVDNTLSDIAETDIYTGPGINENTFKPFEWIKQKRDLYIKGDFVSKQRESIEPAIVPAAKVIGDVTENSTQIFVDDAQFFKYEEQHYSFTIPTGGMGGRLVDTNAPEVASFNVTVSAAGTVSSISIANPGIGYTVSPLDVKFNAPPSIGVGIGTTATATATVSNGRINSVTLTNPGLGYTLGAPNTIVEVPMGTVEEFTSFQNIQGFTGIITGINATTGTNGNAKALKINFRALDPRTVGGEKDLGDATDLQPGYPILIHQTTVGTGVTSIDANDASVVGIGTQFLDNVYIVASKTNIGDKGEIVVNVHSNSNIAGIATTGSFDTDDDAGTLSLGYLSWGRLYNFGNRLNPVSIGVTGLVVDSGLSTFPTITRTGNFGLRRSGALQKEANTNNMSFYP